MEHLTIFMLAVAVSALGVLLLGFFAGRLAFNFRGKPLAIQRPVVWSLGLFTAGRAWFTTGEALLLAAMLLCLLAWDCSPLRRRESRYTQ